MARTKTVMFAIVGSTSSVMCARLRNPYDDRDEQLNRMRQPFLKKKKTRGFTLIETLMSIVIVVILAGVAGPILGVMVEGMGYNLRRTNLQETSALARARMSREIRRLRDDASVVTATASEFVFFDLDDVEIRYRLVGSTLTRTQNGSTEYGLADHVQASGITFIYYDDDGTALAAPVTGIGTDTDIRRVSLKIDFQENADSLSSQIAVSPRNLRHEANLFD